VLSIGRQSEPAAKFSIEIVPNRYRLESVPHGNGGLRSGCSVRFRRCRNGRLVSSSEAVQQHECVEHRLRERQRLIVGFAGFEVADDVVAFS
jgi:hypothetical protein